MWYKIASLNLRFNSTFLLVDFDQLHFSIDQRQPNIKNANWDFEIVIFHNFYFLRCFWHKQVLMQKVPQKVKTLKKSILFSVH